MTDARQRRLEAVAPWLAGLLLACPILVAYYPPMTDLPYHEATIGLLRHFTDPAICPPGLYQLNLGEPNQLFHLVGWVLSYAVSTRWAIKLVVAAAVAAIPVAAARFARHLGASPLSALVVAPMALGWLFSWGLVANLVGLAALLAVLPLLDRFASAPTARGACASIGGAVLLYFAHESMLLVYAGLAVAFAALHPLDRRRTLLRLTPAAFSAVIAAAQLKWQTRFTPRAIQNLPTQWHSLPHKILRIPYIIQPATDLPVQLLMLALCVYAIVAFFWLRSRERLDGDAPVEQKSPQLRALALRYRWEIFVLVTLAAYLTFPFTLNGATLVYERWFPPGFAVLAVVAAPASLWTRSARVPRLAIAVLPLATLLVSAPSFALSSQLYRDLDALMPLIEKGSAVAEVDVGPRDEDRPFSIGTAAGRILAERGGRLAFSFVESAISPVVIQRRYQWDEPMARMGFDALSFRPAHDFRRFRYLLGHSGDPKRSLVLRYALSYEAKVIGESGEWILFEALQPALPVVSRQAYVTGPPPETLRERLQVMYRGVIGAGDTSGATPSGAGAAAP